MTALETADAKLEWHVCRLPFSSWRGEGNLNRSLAYARQGESQISYDALQHAITVDPYFDVPYITIPAKA